MTYLTTPDSMELSGEEQDDAVPDQREREDDERAERVMEDIWEARRADAS